MEFNLISEKRIEFVGGPPSKKKNQPPAPKKKKVVSIKRTHNSSYPFTLTPVLDESGRTAGDTDAEVGFKSFREISIELLFGHTELADQLKGETIGRLTTHLTLTSSKIGRLMIETKGMTPEDDNDDVDIFEGLLKLEENLPPNSLEFTLSLKDFEYDDEDNCSVNSYDDENEMDFIGNGLKLKRNESGSASLEATDIKLPSENWWELWKLSRATTFYGLLSVNVKLDVTAVAELYKRRFGRGPLATELGTPTDVVIFVGGNKDKEKAIKCHKSILSEMSPVLKAMFQVDMLEGKEGTWEIVEFSEVVIRALIEFVYRRNVEEALKSSEMALELLQLADKYEIQELMQILLHIIWSMPCSWFSLDLAIKLFFFAKNAGEGDEFPEAEKKGRMALKWYAKKYPEKLMESQECLRLCESPRAAIEFVVQILNKCDCN